MSTSLAAEEKTVNEHANRTQPDTIQDVVTVFLTHAGRLLLLKRSNLVGTYRGDWAGVSGYLERADPLEQAFTEVAEEVGLSRSDVSLVKAGEPLEVVDAARGRAWRVHPFLFSVEQPEKIRLDWESAEMRWVNPDELLELRTVPALAQALERVLAADGLD
jgi:8-oxo-dGTP diphosphatase